MHFLRKKVLRFSLKRHISACARLYYTEWKKEDDMKKILFTGGGSAGHVLPNLALIDDVRAAGFADVCYMGTEGIEKGLVGGKNIPYYTISCPKLVRGGGFSALKNNLKIPFALRTAVKQAEQGLRLFQPDLVFSKGGYVALPVVFAAKKLKIPCVAHESDLSAGLANRLSAKKCKFVFTSFPETAKTLKNGKYGGAPIRREVLSSEKTAAREKWNVPQNASVLLIFGGGSGSRIINDAVRKNLRKLTEKHFVLHVCGKENVVESNLKNYRQFAFIEDMGSAYAASDLVVSRAGSGTLFELMALKKPALLIPLEGATRGDQLQNAEYFAKRGLCRILPQGQIEKLPEAVEEVLSDGEMKKRLYESRYTQGNGRIIGELRALLHG